MNFKNTFGRPVGGFRVKELIGGLDRWKRDGHPTESVVESLEA